MKNSYRYILGVVMLLLPLSLLAQHSSDKKYYTFEKIEIKNPWVISGNGAGLVFNSAENLGTVAGYFNGESGEYRNVNMPSSYSNFGAHTKSYSQIGKLFLCGSFKYDYGINQDLAWNGTLYPNASLNPIVDSIPGKTLSESYILNGKLGYRLGDQFSIGAAFDYNTSTMAKRIDGRNNNTLSHLNVAPGLAFKSGNLSLGVSANYRREVERVKYSFIGDPTGKKIFYMEGIWFFTSSGISSTTNLARIYHRDLFGGSIQAQYDNGKVAFYNQFTMEDGVEDDFDGDRYSKRYATTDIRHYNYNGQFTLRGDGADHILSLSLLSIENGSYYVVNNYEEVPEELSTWRYYEYGKTLRYITGYQQYGAQYKALLGDGEWRQSWNFLAGYSLEKLSKEYRVYPAEYRQSYSINNLHVGLGKEFDIDEKSLLNIDLKGGYRFSQDGEMLAQINPITTGALRQKPELVEADFLYNTANLYTVGATLRYSRVLNPELGRTLSFTGYFNLLNSENLGSRGFYGLSIGFNF